MTSLSKPLTTLATPQILQTPSPPSATTTAATTNAIPHNRDHVNPTVNRKQPASSVSSSVSAPIPVSSSIAPTVHIGRNESSINTSVSRILAVPVRPPGAASLSTPPSSSVRSPAASSAIPSSSARTLGAASSTLTGASPSSPPRATAAAAASSSSSSSSSVAKSRSPLALEAPITPPNRPVTIHCINCKQGCPKQIKSESGAKGEEDNRAMAVHETQQCEYRNVSCPLCEKVIQKQQHEAHKSECTGLVLCTFCGESLRASLLRLHQYKTGHYTIGALSRPYPPCRSFIRCRLECDDGEHHGHFTHRELAVHRPGCDETQIECDGQHCPERKPHQIKRKDYESHLFQGSDLSKLLLNRAIVATTPKPKQRQAAAAADASSDDKMDLGDQVEEKKQCHHSSSAAAAASSSSAAAGVSSASSPPSTRKRQSFSPFGSMDSHIQGILAASNYSPMKLWMHVQSIKLRAKYQNIMNEKQIKSTLRQVWKSGKGTNAYNDRRRTWKRLAAQAKSKGCSLDYLMSLDENIMVNYARLDNDDTSSDDDSSFDDDDDEKENEQKQNRSAQKPKATAVASPSLGSVRIHASNNRKRPAEKDTKSKAEESPAKKTKRDEK